MDAGLRRWRGCPHHGTADQDQRVVPPGWLSPRRSRPRRSAETDEPESRRVRGAWTAPTPPMPGLPGEVGLALRLAESILKESARQGVRLGLGVACGRVKPTPDLLEHNVTGVVVNRAARLAHLPGGTGKIAVETQSAADALGASSSY